VDVRADQYVYTAASSGLGIRLPAWALEGGQSSITERLTSEETWQRIRAEMKDLIAERGLTDYAFAVVASYRPDPSYNGRSIADLAAARGDGSLNGQLELIRDMMRAGGASMVYHFMSEGDLGAIAKHPFVSFASDASVNTIGEGVPHPRGYGNNARVLGRYVREQRLLSLEEAVRKMTSQPAAHFRLVDRGLLKPDAAADIVVFDASRVGDPATYDRPHQYADGIVYVFVNAVAVIRRGEHTGARPGQVVRGYGGMKTRR
jgi:N-acyl-D-amino-acid deacylase